MHHRKRPPSAFREAWGSKSAASSGWRETLPSDDGKKREASDLVHIVWFKTTDLRIHDHAPLTEAHAAAARTHGSVLHILTLDNKWYGSEAKSRCLKITRTGRRRAEFLHNSIVDLKKTLSQHGQELHVYFGSSRDAFIELKSIFRNIVKVHAHGPEFIDEEKQVEDSVCAELGDSIPLSTHWGWTLHHIDDLPASMKKGEKTPGRYKPFLKMVQRGKKSATARDPFPAPGIWASQARFEPPAVPGSKWMLPSPLQLSGEEIKIRNPIETEGGEQMGLQAMKRYIWTEDRLRKYVGSSDSMSPGKYNALNSTTGLSAYLAHGCISPRLLYAEVQQYEKKRVKNRSTYWVFHELVFRDFFVFSAIRWGNTLFHRRGPLNSSGHPWRKDNAETRRLFRRWTEGLTGYPFVDAGMRQLRTEGRMPHLLRQICAGFLVRDLRIDWRWGAEWFERQLVDYTPDANWGNWGYRILPVQQLLPLEQKHLTSLEILSWPVVHDPHQEYILKWIPELRQLVTT
eukprot:jgi/Bigna1/41078/e_gw1.49.21.1